MRLPAADGVAGSAAAVRGSKFVGTEPPVVVVPVGTTGFVEAGDAFAVEVDAVAVPADVGVAAEGVPEVDAVAGPSVSASGPPVIGEDGSPKASAGGAPGAAASRPGVAGASSDAIESADDTDAPEVAGAALGVTKAKYRPTAATATTTTRAARRAPFDTGDSFLG